MRRADLKSWILAVAVASSMAACNTASRVSEPPESALTATEITAQATSALVTPESASPATLTPLSQAATSSPEAILPSSPLNQTAGQLESLESYRAILHVTASGTQNDQAFSWEYTITQTVSVEPKLSMIAVRASELGSGENITETLLIDQGNRLLARWSSEGECVEVSTDLALGLFETLFTLFPDFEGAQNDKDGALEGLPADHYSLDGSTSGVSGELWVARDGEFLLEASLEQAGSLPSLGSGAIGNAAWEYSLTNINKAMTLAIPISCSYLLGGFPLPKDATELAASEESITFITSQSPTDLTAFYDQAMQNEGWESFDPPDVSGNSSQMTFIRQAERVFISALRAGETTHVTVLITAGNTETGNTSPSP